MEDFPVWRHCGRFYTFGLPRLTHEANLLGSSLALYLSHLLASRRRHRQHVAQLYQPIRPLASSDSAYQDLAQQPADVERGHADDVWDHADDEYGTGVVKVFDLGEDEEEEAEPR